MVRAPCCEKMGLKKGPWTPEEDQILISHIEKYGHDNWRALPKKAGLLRCGKSCRLRWLNYLRSDIKRGNFTKEEEETIIKLHEMLGNRWSAIAAKLPGRTDNEIKNVWHTHLKKKLIKNSNHNVDQEITKRHDEYSVKDEAAEVHDMISSKYDYNIMENIRPISPPQSSSASDISSVITTDNDNNDDDNNNNTSTKVNSLVNFSEMADDESFWSEVFSTEGSYSEVLVDFSTINSEPQKFQFSPLVMTSESLDDFGSNIMDFWHHIFIKSGDLLAEF